MVPSLGVKGAAHLLDVYGSAEAVFDAGVDSLVSRAQLRPDVARSIASCEAFRAAEREMDYCRTHGIRPVASTDSEYPPLLKSIPDYPHVIYVRGNVEALSMRAVTFVGTRAMTPYGESACNMLVAGLARRVPGICIVSGLAYGIDAAAHRAALAAGVPTVAVIANPLPKINPVPHTALARDIIDRGGAVITELSSATKYNGSFYISRNRILAAIAAGTVVVESAASGGSLATARFADSYDRAVMAVPGRINERASQGTNALISNRKALAVTCAEDIVRELMWDLGLPEPRRFASPVDEVMNDLLPGERALLACMRCGEAVTSDELAARSGMSPDELAAALMSLEMSGAVRMLAGDKYEVIENL